MDIEIGGGLIQTHSYKKKILEEIAYSKINAMFSPKAKQESALGKIYGI